MHVWGGRRRCGEGGAARRRPSGGSSPWPSLGRASCQTRSLRPGAAAPSAAASAALSALAARPRSSPRWSAERSPRTNEGPSFAGTLLAARTLLVPRSPPPPPCALRPATATAPPRSSASAAPPTHSARPATQTQRAPDSSLRVCFEVVCREFTGPPAHHQRRDCIRGLVGHEGPVLALPLLQATRGRRQSAR